MKHLVVLLKLILVFESVYLAVGFQCVCLQNKDSVNCGANGFSENRNKNVVRANIDGFGRLLANSIPFGQATHVRIQCEIAHVQSDSFQNQQTIKILELSRNQLNDFPTNTFVSLPFLEKLDISWNKFKNPTLDTFGRLNNLKELDLSHNILTNIHLGVLDIMRNLEKLNLNDNKISVLRWGVFDMLTNLKKLDLSNNHLNVIELNIFELTTSLEEVNLSGNELSDDEALIGLDSLASVVNLDLSDCKISKLPMSVFTSLKKLKKLNLYFNPIKTLPKLFDEAKGLTTLYMSYNKLSSIPAHMFDHNRELEEVDWSYNQLTTLPDGLFNFTENFKYLNISHNEIDQLPLKIFQWSSLTEIDVSYNDFTTLETELLNMETLERVHAQHNKITFLEDTAFSSCTFPLLYINLQYNRLVYLQPYFFDWLANLEKLEIFGNPWDCSCLEDLLKLLTERYIEYDADNYKTTKPICVAGENRVCQNYNTNLTYFYEMYKHIL